MYPYCTVDGCEILHLGWLKQQLKACDFAHFSTTAIFHIISPTINLHQHPYSMNSMNISIFYHICFLLCIPYASWDNKHAVAWPRHGTDGPQAAAVVSREVSSASGMGSQKRSLSGLEDRDQWWIVVVTIVVNSSLKWLILVYSG